MASTFTAGQAFDYSKRFIKNMPLEQVQVQILDDVNKMMWMKAPWRWTINTFPTVALTNNTQDYSVAIPSDFLYLQDSYITDAKGGVPINLSIQSFLPPGGKLGVPTSCAVIGAAGTTGTYRLFPQPGSLNPNWEVISLYKKTAPVIQPSNINTPGVLLFDDEWFWVYVSGILYFAYLYGDDQRAGGAQLASNGQVQFSGQRGVFEANMQIMLQREKLMTLTTVIPEQKETT